MIMKRRYFTVTVMLSLIFAFVTADTTAQSLTPKQLTAEYDKILSDQFKAGETGCAALVARTDR